MKTDAPTEDTCSKCGSPLKVIKKAAVPANVLSHSIVTPSLVEHELQQKYAMNHKVQLETFLSDGSLEISNNLCESHIHPFATGRKSWLFADTPQGATASAVAYTLAESAKANGLNIYFTIYGGVTYCYILEKERGSNLEPLSL